MYKKLHLHSYFLPWVSILFFAVHFHEFNPMKSMIQFSVYFYTNVRNIFKVFFFCFSSLLRRRRKYIVSCVNPVEVKISIRLSPNLVDITKQHIQSKYELYGPYRCENTFQQNFYHH